MNHLKVMASRFKGIIYYLFIRDNVDQLRPRPPTLLKELYLWTKTFSLLPDPPTNVVPIIPDGLEKNNAVRDSVSCINMYNVVQYIYE